MYILIYSKLWLDKEVEFVFKVWYSLIIEKYIIIVNNIEYFYNNCIDKIYNDIRSKKL